MKVSVLLPLFAAGLVAGLAAAVTPRDQAVATTVAPRDQAAAAATVALLVSARPDGRPAGFWIDAASCDRPQREEISSALWRCRAAARAAARAARTGSPRMLKRHFGTSRRVARVQIAAEYDAMARYCQELEPEKGRDGGAKTITCAASGRCDDPGFADGVVSVGKFKYRPSPSGVALCREGFWSFARNCRDLGLAGVFLGFGAAIVSRGYVYDVWYDMSHWNDTVWSDDVFMSYVADAYEMCERVIYMDIARKKSLAGRFRGGWLP